MFSTHSITFSYNSSKIFSYPDISLTGGEDLLILGESGIGKTTFLHIMAGLLRPITGELELLGTRIDQLSDRQLDHFRGKNIGLVYQRFQFIRSLVLEENLMLVQKLAGVKRDLTKIKDILASLNIADKLKTPPHRLSQGEQQRAAMAMAMVNSPNLILADEPTANLDDKNCEKVASILKQQARDTDAHMIIITHDQRLKSHFKNQIQL
ncbi:ATP-binding cassette domain-containing protein [Fulvivirga maritima]|uniref:ABC transporter ATP-binding protein n=1 Tax=Fulvivirga maritima TaxID=2904247 RepID=UPI001F4777D1|nr:ATP-binding cassette domain-containing protein [Fulvivirga maritima]UII26027.1 ATP-binding cassette domain-containing protein [Fulvivirga maritima]